MKTYFLTIGILVGVGIFALPSLTYACLGTKPPQLITALHKEGPSQVLVVPGAQTKVVYKVSMTMAGGAGGEYPVYGFGNPVRDTIPPELTFLSSRKIYNGLPIEVLSPGENIHYDCRVQGDEVQCPTPNATGYIELTFAVRPDQCGKIVKNTARLGSLVSNTVETQIVCLNTPTPTPSVTPTPTVTPPPTVTPTPTGIQFLTSDGRIVIIVNTNDSNVNNNSNSNTNSNDSDNDVMVKTGNVTVTTGSVNQTVTQDQASARVPRIAGAQVVQQAAITRAQAYPAYSVGVPITAQTGAGSWITLLTLATGAGSLTNILRRWW